MQPAGSNRSGRPCMMFSSGQPVHSPGSVVPLLSAELGAARRHFYRWPLVPSRELKRIRQVLLRCATAGGAEPDTVLSGSAQALLDLVTAELQRRGEPAGRPVPAVSRQDLAPAPRPREGSADGRTV